MKFAAGIVLAVAAVAGVAAESTTTFVVPTSNPPVDPKTLVGLGPQVPAGSNSEVKKAMDDLAKKNGNTNTLDISKIPRHKTDPAMFIGIGPELRPGMPGYGQNAQFNKAWKDVVDQKSLSQSGSTADGSAPKCPEFCPDQFEPVCGSDGVQYSNSCFLGIASCENPDKHITVASQDGCPKKSPTDGDN